jgi:hypothetical protein
MDEAIQEQSTEDSGERLQSKGSSIISELDTRIERLEKANKEAARINEERAEIMAREAVYGRSEAAEKPKKEDKMSDAEYAQAFLEGKINVK